MSMRVKKSDRVRVISGKDKGKEGKILRRIPVRDLVVVEGVNMVSRHMKPNQKKPTIRHYKARSAHLCLEGDVSLPTVRQAH